MHLKKITLNNFRCFKHLEIDLDRHLTVIVGENGAGKTALLDGIATALSPVLTYLSSSNQRLTGRGIKDTDFQIESWKGKGGKEQWGSADYVQIIAEANVNRKDVKWDYWRPSSPGKEPPKKYGEAELKTQLQIISESYKTLDPHCPPVFAYYGDRRGHIQVPERIRESKENYDHPSSALIGALDSKSDFKEMLKWFDLEETSELRANKGVPEKDFQESLSLFLVRRAIIFFLGGEFKNPHFNKEHKFVLERKSDRALLHIAQLSQGYQSMLALAMDFIRRITIANKYLYEASTKINAENIANGICTQEDIKTQIKELIITTPAIMLVDEIDLHLHPSWQQRVLTDLLEAFPFTQFIVTTHSPQVLTSVDSSCIRVLRQTSDTENQNKETVIDLVKVQTRGVSSVDLLAKIMGVDPIPDVPEARMLSQYHALIEQNLHETPDGQKLRLKLDAHFGADHPVMLECHRMIRLQGFKQKLPLPKRSS